MLSRDMVDGRKRDRDTEVRAVAQLLRREVMR
jgi:hypothetical protein